MKVTPIGAPLPGEHLAATSPVMRPETADARWRARLDFWAGRSLTSDALDLEQTNRAARLAWRGRLATPGIVSGLEVSLETPAAPGDVLAPDGHFIHVQPGQGFLADGEDVVVPRPLRVPLADLDIRYVRLTYASRGLPAEPVPARAAPGQDVDAGGFIITVDTFPRDAESLAWAAVLVLRPAELRMFARHDPSSPCEADASRDPFADERRLDAGILTLCQLPIAWQDRPQLADRGDPRWRNRLADVVLGEEARRSARHQMVLEEATGQPAHWTTVLREADPLPWEVLGVPLAILSSELPPGATVRRYFLDRSSVTRTAGRARPRTRPALGLAASRAEASLVPGRGSPFNWRARVDQFTEQLGTLPTGNAEDVAALRARFQFVPPCGFLPRQLLDLLTTSDAIRLRRSLSQRPDRAGVNHLFPPTVNVDAAPVAIEDLDAALAASAALAPYDLQSSTEDFVRVLVPLPQQVFEPDVLVVEEEDPLFAATVARFAATRQDWRQRRDRVRRRRDELEAFIAPRPAIPAPAFDPGQLEPEPTETVPGLGFTRAYFSPTTTSPPWGLSVTFAPQSVAPDSTLLAWLRPDIDAPPSLIDVEWRSGEQRFRFSFTAEVPQPVSERVVNGQAQAIPLWQPFTIQARAVGIATEMAIDGFSVQIADGRIGVLGTGRERPEPGSAELVVDIWWRAQDPAPPQPQFVGGDWTRFENTDQFLAPFEDPFEPMFDGDTLEDRLDDLDFQLRAAAPNRVRTIGLQALIERVQREVNQADDAVDLDFLKAQSNVHRIRQVMLGEEVANELLTSPALGSVVKQQSARVAQETLINTLKSVPSIAPAVAGVAGNTRAGDAFRAGAVFEKAGGFVVSARATDTSALLDLRAIASDSLPSAIDRGFRLDRRGGAAEAIPPVKDDVIAAEPVVGKGFELRTLTIAKRFDDGPTRKAYDFADAELRATVARIVGLPLEFDDTDTIPEVRLNNNPVSYRALATGGTAMLNQLQYPALGANDDSSAIFGQGVRRADATVLILRRLELYIARKREQLRRAREALAGVITSLEAASARMLAIEGRLAEARHDVGVARALRQEEIERVDTINVRRDRIIAQEVKFLAYVRPRAVDLVKRTAPYWTLEPAGVAPPVPACLQRHDEPPQPLHAYLQLFRHAPAKWFGDVFPLIATLDTPEKLAALLDGARASAVSFSVQQTAALLRAPSPAVELTVLGARQAVGNLRQLATQIQIFSRRARWQELLREAQDHASVGDLIAGRHGSPDVSTAAAGELERIAAVATCLHAEFAAVTPAIRLEWIERFSQFDRPAPLRDLTVLPQYGRLDRQARRRLQEFVDWLFARVRPTERDAGNLINDLVRLCLLLASHAPVNRIIAGHVPRPTLVRPGIQIPIRPLNPELVRVGMHFQVWQATRVVARGRVEDLAEDEVSARVDHVEAQTTTIDTTMRVQFVPAALSLMRF